MAYLYDAELNYVTWAQNSPAPPTRIVQARMRIPTARLIGDDPDPLTLEYDTYVLIGSSVRDGDHWCAIYSIES